MQDTFSNYELDVSKDASCVKRFSEQLPYRPSEFPPGTTRCIRLCVRRTKGSGRRGGRSKPALQFCIQLLRYLTRMAIAKPGFFMPDVSCCCKFFIVKVLRIHAS